jgi:hypothetical protein
VKVFNKYSINGWSTVRNVYKSEESTSREIEAAGQNCK